MKRAAFFFVLVSAVFLSSCGNNNNYYGTSLRTSDYKDRLVYDNFVTGAVNMVDIDITPFVPFTSSFANLTMPKQMLLAPDRSFFVVYDDSQYNLTIISSTTQTTTATMSVNYHTDSIVMSSDGKSAYAAVPDVPELNAPTGAVLSYNLTAGTAGAQVAVPGARRLSISNDGKSLLVFADNNNSVYYIDLTATSLKAVPIAGFNQPYSAVFSSDNSTAYVLNCGTECSGTVAPSVQPVAISTTAQTPGTPVNVPGATKGILNGTTLYVAGNDLTQATGKQGTLSVIDTTSMAVTNSYPIADGLHDKIALFASKLWIGSSNCSTTHCLSIFDTTSNAVTIGNSTGNVTGLAAAPVKNWMFVVQGGQLFEYNVSTLSETVPYAIPGQAWNVVLLDQ